MKKGYIFLFVILFIPFSVKALTGSININCGSNTVKKGDTVTCSVTGTSDEVVTAFEADLMISGNASGVSFTSTYDKWEKCSLTDDKTSVGCYANASDISGNFNFGNLVLKIADDASGSINVGFSNVSLSDSNFHTFDVSGVSINGATLNIASSEETTTPAAETPSETEEKKEEKTTEAKAAFFAATLDTNSKLYLTELNVDGYNLDFSKDKLNYLLSIGEEDSLVITPVLNDESLGSYSIDGNSNLADGSLITITLTPNDGGSEVKYTITISKESNNTLVDTVTTGNSNNKKLSTIIFGIIIGSLVIINIARMLLNKKKNSAE